MAFPSKSDKFDVEIVSVVALASNIVDYVVYVHAKGVNDGEQMKHSL